MSMTDLTIGAPTALHRICEAIDNINSTAFSHSRAFVLEVMGRHCGWLALLAGVAYVFHYTSSKSLLIYCNAPPSGGADFIFIPERPPKGKPWEDEMCAAIQDVSRLPSFEGFFLSFSYPSFQHREVGKRKTIVIVAEGAHDLDLNPIKAEYVKDVLTDRLGLDTRVTTLGHTQRGGRPCAFDRILVPSFISCSQSQTNVLFIAYTPRCRSCSSIARVYPRNTVIYDWYSREQDH